MFAKDMFRVLGLLLLISITGTIGFFATQHYGVNSANRERRPAVSTQSWRFAVSGDSRNCGDLIMPSIAAGAKQAKAQFYWHLGDFRALYSPDEDLQADPKYVGSGIDPVLYQKIAWPDFIENQLKPFEPVPVYLGIGNHETVDRDRSEYTTQFAPWLNTSEIQQTRAADGDPSPAPKTYYHVVKNGIDFITLDNATGEQFDIEQMTWLRALIARDAANANIRTVVLGMHQALPDSIAFGHSMSESEDPNAVISGREVYHLLLGLQNDSHKNVYVLMSHSHLFMDGIFNTPYWVANGGILPGWIVGTAGAERVKLPADAIRARKAMQDTYGYLLATVNPTDDTIQFDFQEIKRDQLIPQVASKYGDELIDFCFNKNKQKKKKKKKKPGQQSEAAEE